ncbi:MAG: SAM-dependent methyltransferase [Panacagrimonas sp.]|jgi:cyclopropane-fatty-acyl-phospholipid synthase|nr:cyclopropane-fatty-acyl-phospholipid synthase family protein [Panacagrimonas sp.]MCC2657458.1 SAM-dependent methyltransferase [Panacagrimonas sp.]
MDAVLDWKQGRFRHGSLTFEAPDGASWNLGHGAPQARIRLHRKRSLWRMLLHPDLQFGEAYVEGAWDPLGCTLEQVLEAAVAMTDSDAVSARWRVLSRAAERIAELNDAWIAARRIRHHYDVDSDLYATFLDRDLHYSCAYFADPTMDLEAAQQAKCALIAAKLDLRPNARVLDIGCGWGSLALYLAEKHGARVTAITLSPGQFEVARRRAAERGLTDRVEFRLQDYRLTEGRFDAIVSVGMFEHVGRPQYPRFFETMRERLAHGGTALLHTIGRNGPPAPTNAWIRRHIFPGGYIPAASEVLEALEPSGLRLTDFEIWRLHYALTLAEWNRRFQARRSEFAQRLGERFCRIWEFYLQGSEASFRQGGLVVFQLQMGREINRLPMTRDYLYR